MICKRCDNDFKDNGNAICEKCDKHMRGLLNMQNDLFYGGMLDEM